MTRIRIDIHQTLCVLEPASMALALSHQAPSLPATVCLHPWHLSKTFKCLLISLSMWPAQPRQRRNDIWDEGEMGNASSPLPPLTVSLGFLSTYQDWYLVDLSFRNAWSNQIWKQCGRLGTWAISLWKWCTKKKLTKRGTALAYLCPLEMHCSGR